ncbi:MAG: DUF2007 domain-containing protein [Chitinophagaceae bacterium]
MNTHNTDETVILEVFTDPVTAAIAQSKLTEAGVESFLQEENVMGLNPTGGVELKVFSHDRDKAKELLSK